MVKVNLTTNLILLFLKILKKLRLIDKFNFYVKKYHNGKSYALPIDSGLGLSSYIIKEDWLDQLIFLFKTSEIDNSFVDVGVNTGQTLLRLKSVNKDFEYLGFEPNSSCVHYVKKLVKMNNFTNCTVFCTALSNKVDILSLGKSTISDQSASVVSELRPNYFSESDDILSFDYDSFFRDKKIDLVKIDVEGAELEVISGMKYSIMDWKPIIICEVLDAYSLDALNFTQVRANKLCELLEELDYKIIHLETNKVNDLIVRFTKVDEFIINLWSNNSYYLNDYIFCPSECIDLVVSKLNFVL
jgi:FkbM family methyltransferase